MTDNPWRIRDKGWLQARREHWKRIEGQLKNISIYLEYYKKQIRFHKAYFLKGELMPYDQKWVDAGYKVDPGIIGRPFDLHPMFRMWYHPVIDNALFEEWGKAATNQEKISVFTMVERGIDVDTKFEFFEDRSYFIDRYLVPKTCDEVMNLHHNMNYSPEKILYLILYSINRCLRGTRVTVGCGNYLLCFSFDLLIDSLREADLTACPMNTVGDSLGGWLYQELQKSLFATPGNLYSEHGLPLKLKKMLPEVFEVGVSSEVDSLWEKAKQSKDEWEAKRPK